jgi:hypothetical protein
MEKARVTYSISEEQIMMILKSYFKETYGEVYDWQLYDDGEGIKADIRVKQDIRHV